MKFDLDPELWPSNGLRMHLCASLSVRKCDYWAPEIHQQLAGKRVVSLNMAPDGRRFSSIYRRRTNNRE